MKQFAVIAEGVVKFVARREDTAPAYPPDTFTVVDITDMDPQPQDDWHYEDGTFRPPATRPTLSISASLLTVFRGQTTTLTGDVVDAEGNRDTTFLMPPTVVSFPHPRGGSPVVVEYRVRQGQLEMNTEAGWASDIPFSSNHSGRFDITAPFEQWFRIDAPVVITVLR